jgi:hypothetical protein
MSVDRSLFIHYNIPVRSRGDGLSFQAYSSTKQNKWIKYKKRANGIHCYPTCTVALTKLHSAFPCISLFMNTEITNIFCIIPLHDFESIKDPCLRILIWRHETWPFLMMNWYCLLTKGALWLMSSQIYRYRQLAEDSEKLYWNPSLLYLSVNRSEFLLIRIVLLR